KFGAGIFVADLVSIAVAREMAAVITAVVMSGRTGAAFAAELASMQANEEIDALAVLGIAPIGYLVLPRVLALLLMMPLLYVYGCVAGLLGGLVVSAGMLNLGPAIYLDRTFLALTPAHLLLGGTKAAVFGALVALAGCYYGLRARRDAVGVGVSTTRAVVACIVRVIAIDSVIGYWANVLDIYLRPMSTCTLTVKNLCMSVGEADQRRIIQQDVGFEVRAGTIFAIMGSSGCGKSTLLRHLVGLSKPAGGQVCYEQEDF